MIQVSSFTAVLLAGVTYADSNLSYDYKQNGADWATIHNAEWALCDSGREQSPIDLKKKATTTDNIELIGFNYFDFTVADSAKPTAKNAYKIDLPSPQLENARIELTMEDKSKENYTPTQFHFHAPSEHTVDGKNHDLEIHIVHKKQGTGIPTKPIEYGAVIGIFFDVADDADDAKKDNPFIDSVFKAVASTDSTTTDDDVSVAIREFFRKVDFTEFWSYPGSFTTPPCTEGLRWSVIKQVQPISKAQLKLFTDLWAGDEEWAESKGNNRLTQPLYDRKLYMTKAGASSPLLAGAATALAAIAALSF